MRMVVVSKKDRKPQCIVNVQPINKFYLRETHHTPSTFDVVSSLPQQVYKTVLDAYNGYHQVLLGKESIKLTTFMTDQGRYQNLGAPQRHLASGDAYTRRYDNTIADVLRKLKIIDEYFFMIKLFKKLTLVVSKWYHIKP